MAITVFDFDKTLTQKDTFNLFLYFVAKHYVFYIPKRIIYFTIIFLRKIRLISNITQKTFALNLFLPDNEESIDKYIIPFAKSIIMNKNIVSMMRYQQTHSNVIICSASPKKYIQYIFPESYVIGLEFTKNIKYYITRHPYLQQKLNFIKEIGITEIDELFTDSYSDRYLAKISKVINVVKNETIITYNDYHSYKKHFK